MEFAKPDRFVAGAAGEGEQRRFYIQVREGNLLASVAISRGQLTMLSMHLGAVLEEACQMTGMDAADPDRTFDFGPLEVPLLALFTVSQLQAGWDPISEIIRVSLSDPEGEPPFRIDVLLTAKLARRFGTRVDRVIRNTPACPLCGQQIAQEGHICPRLDGYQAVSL